MTSGRCTGGANQSFSFLSRYKSVGGYTVVQLLTYPETPDNSPITAFARAAGIRELAFSGAWVMTLLSYEPGTFP